MIGSQHEAASTFEQATYRATLSMLDVIEELAQGLAHGQKPGSDWAQTVVDTFDVHRKEMADLYGAKKGART